jgi:bifunctional UDP-N-acetylglucosamine pyrophosphorylase/glucosamine-1-phosphate N-acetyltransferase
VKKHPTVIGDDVFIGSDSMLVAPVTIGRQAVIGAGSVITDHAPPEALTLARARQTTLLHWRRRKK